MITSSSGYKCLNVTNPDLSDFITGDILPVRDNRGDGSWRTMKYEDLLFLQEANRERINWDKEDFGYGSSGITKESPYGRVVYWSPFSFMIFISSHPPSYYIDKDANITSSLTSFSGDFASAYPISNWIPNIGTNRNKRLNSDTMRKMYFNLSLLKRTVHSVNVSNGMSAIHTNQYWKYYNDAGVFDPPSPKSSEPTRFEWTEILAGFPLYSFGGSSGRFGTIVNWYSNFTQDNTLVSVFPNAKSASVVLVVSSDNNGLVYEDIYAIPATVSAGGEIHCNIAPALQGVLSSAIIKHGIPYLEDCVDMEGAHASVDITGIYVIVDNEFPAEIDSLNWDWEPSTI